MDLVEKASIFKKQNISLEEIQTWSTDTLKDYCQNRACNIPDSGLELYVRVYYLYNNSIQNCGRITQWWNALLKDLKFTVQPSATASCCGGELFTYI